MGSGFCCPRIFLFFYFLGKIGKARLVLTLTPELQADASRETKRLRVNSLGLTPQGELLARACLSPSVYQRHARVCVSVCYFLSVVLPVIFGARLRCGL